MLSSLPPLSLNALLFLRLACALSCCLLCMPVCSWLSLQALFLRCMYRCAICFEEFSPSVLVRVLPCRHIFHRSCLDTWFQRSAVSLKGLGFRSSLGSYVSVCPCVSLSLSTRRAFRLSLCVSPSRSVCLYCILSLSLVPSVSLSLAVPLYFNSFSCVRLCLLL